MLENLSYPFLKPNILDIKLGTILYDESAPPEKVSRMIQTAQETTSLETGVRITGFQVHDNITSEPVHVPKSYGRSTKASDLSDGISLFFPLASSTPTNVPTATSDTSAHNIGLPRHLLLPILQAVREDIADVRDTLSEIHLRMVGTSVLIVYEADWARAEEGVKALELEMREREEDENENDSKAKAEAEAEAEISEDDGEGDDEDEDYDVDDDDDMEGPTLPYTVKLIDFAHTRIKPGHGPDEGVLLGLDTILKLLDGRIEQVYGAPVGELNTSWI